MAHTVELLSLINDYPEAFLEPTETPIVQASTSTRTSTSDSDGLMSLISEFPEAFTEPEEQPQSPDPSELKEQPQAQSVQNESTAHILDAPSFKLPAGYEMALHQTLTTFGWGQVEVFLRYESQTLRSVWIQVGKSGTEVQSFCEAIARLSNRLLAAGTPISEIVKDLRGIRGGDSEGLGPHRFLGLVDLFGKVLQEAPETLNISAPASPSPPHSQALEATRQEMLLEVTSPEATSEPTVSPTSSGHQWVELSDTSAIASLCPECGAELHQVNGCSGGACVVCGYSSCS